MLLVCTLLLCSIRSDAPRRGSIRSDAPRRGGTRPALLRGGALSQHPPPWREWSDTYADALWENVSAVWTDVSELWNRTRREEALLMARDHATPLLLEFGQRLPAGEYALPLDDSTCAQLLELLDGTKLTLAARRPRRIRRPELAAAAQALLDAFGSQLTVSAASIGGRCGRWDLPRPMHRASTLPAWVLGAQGCSPCAWAAGVTCRPTARGSSSTRAPCVCWASGATAPTSRQSARVRGCDSSPRQARAMGCRPARHGL